MRPAFVLALLRSAALIGLAASASDALAQRLTVEQISQRPETWIGAWPSQPFWTDAGDAVYFEWNPRGEMPADSLWRVDPAGGTPERVPADERRQLAPRVEDWGSRAYAPDGRRHAFARGGDVWVYDQGTGRNERVTRTTARESDPVFLADGSLVWRQGDALFRADGLGVEQLTDLREGKEPPEDEPSPQAAFLRDQQRRLLDVVRERARLDSLAEAARERDQADPDAPPTFYVGEQSVGALAVGAGRAVRHVHAHHRRRARADAARGLRDRDRRRARDPLPAQGGRAAHRRRALGPGPRPRHDLRRRPVDAARRPGPPPTTPANAAPPPTRSASSCPSGRTGAPTETGPSSTCARSTTRTAGSRAWTPATGTVTSLDRQRDEAWLAGPGIAWWGGASAVGWLPDGRFWFHSEKTGWSHLTAVDRDGTVEPLTSGAFEVETATLAGAVPGGVAGAVPGGVSPDGQTWILQTSEGDLGQRHVWRMPVAPAGEAADAFARRERLTDAVGRWDASLSPDGERLALLHSTASRPPEVFVMPLGGTPVQVTESTTPAWRAYPWREAEIVEVPASDGALVPARIYRPEDVGATPNGAAVLFVHGAGYLQNAHRWWSGYVREYQFHHLLAERGYVVLDLDYRASAGYGRDWRTAVYRHMGGRDLQDYVDASEYVGREFGIGPERVAIYGGSYGGFLTLMALFTEPEHFGGGAALRSVTDWAHYNDTYTRNILNTPLQDPVAYRRSSPIEFAAGLEDPLLMTHGLVDDNVQPQDIFRLSQRLIELGKRDWELAIAPVEPHSYTEPTSWADKLARILDLIDHSVGPDRADGTEG